MKRANALELQAMHHHIDSQIRRLERRGMHMTPPEQSRAAELKKQRLATKDQIVDLERIR